MQDVGDKAKDAANQTEGAIKDAAGAVKDKVSEHVPRNNGTCVGCWAFRCQCTAPCRDRCT
jgi:hypothetical protein